MAVEYIIYEQLGDYGKDLRRYNDGYILYVGNNEIDEEFVDVVRFDQVKAISNYPNIDRLQGVWVDKGANKRWMTYHKGIMSENLRVYDKGTLEIVESGDNYKLVEFRGEKLTGQWYIRRGSEDRALMWKPPVLNRDDKFSCAKMCDDLEEVGEKRRDKFSSVIQMSKNGFRGTAMASGVYQGQGGIPTLFTNKFIKKMVDKYSNDPKKIKVDFDHDENAVGAISDVRLETDPVYRFYITGEAGRNVKNGSGLSVDFTVDTIWDEKFKIEKAIDADIHSVSILTESNPGCEMCFVDKSGGRYE